VPLDLETLRDIFTAYGEVGIASNDALLEDMVEAATTNPNGITPSGKLDLHAFFVALTSDVKLYDTLNEVRSTTNYQDVFEPDDERGRKGDDDDSEAVEDSWSPEENFTTHEVKLRFTAPSIDITAGTYRSKGLMVFLWVRRYRRVEFQELPRCSFSPNLIHEQKGNRAYFILCLRISIFS